jgi:flagellar basal-body rod protein FlgG
MLLGFHAGASGINYNEERQKVITHNLSNQSTDSFKKSLLMLQTRQQNPDTRGVDSAVRAGLSPFYGVQRNGVYKNLASVGSVQTTNNPMDVAINENTPNAFFAVKHSDGSDPRTYYTRNGKLSIGLQNRLDPNSPNVLYVAGHMALDPQNQPIPIDPAAGSIEIGRDGQVFQAGAPIAELAVFRMNKSADPLKQENANLQLLESKEGLLYSIPDFVKEVVPFRINPDDNPNILRQGAIEGSNVNALQEMVEMMNTTRSASANQLAMSTHAGLLEKLFQYARA